MTNFAQALARIEELLKEPEGRDYAETIHLLKKHADSIVQLGEIAGQLRDVMRLLPANIYNDATLRRAKEIRDSYDKLMKGE